MKIEKGQRWRRRRDKKLFRVWSVDNYADGRTYVRLTPERHFYSSCATGAILATTLEARYAYEGAGSAEQESS
jgi:hypothetical protein